MIKTKSKRTVAICCIILIVCLAVVASMGILLDRKVKQDPSEGNAYTVTFYSNDSTVLKVDTVPAHQSATSPILPEMSYGNVFVKWDKAFSDVTENLDVYPIINYVKNEKNAFVLSGAYGQKETDVFVSFQLCGEVCVSGFDVRVQYDPESLELLSVFNVDGGVVYNDSIPGVIKLNYVSIEDTTADIDICTFKFKIKSNAVEIPLQTSVMNVYAGSNDKLHESDFMTVNSTVYVYESRAGADDE